MGQLGEAVVVVRPDLEPLDQGLDQAEGRARKFAASITGILAGIGTAAAARGLFDAARKAADLGESVSKTGAVFGQDGGQIVRFADEMAKRFGKVKQETIDAATNLGVMGVAAGMTARESAGLGVELSKIAFDLESMHNVPFAEVAQSLRSVLAGESEPGRRFGLFLTEAAVQAEAFRLGLARTNKELTEQDKILARLSLIKQSPAIGKASGDLARTADSAANQLRKFEGELENFKTDFGKNFIDPMNNGIKLARDLGGVLGDALGNAPGETLGSRFDAAIRGARAIIDAGNAPSRRKTPELQESWLTRALSEAFFPDQARADRLAGVQTANEADLARIEADRVKADKDSRAFSRGQAVRQFLAERRAMNAVYDRQLRDAADLRTADKGKALAGAGRELAEGFLARLRAAGGLLSQDRAKSLGAETILAQGAGPAGKLALAAAAAIRSGVDRAQRGPERFGAAAVYSDPADFARSAVQQALEYDPAAKDREKANQLLEQLTDLMKTLIQKTGQGAAAILRGRS